MVIPATQNICKTCIQCWTNVEDVGPANKCYANVLCFLGYCEIISRYDGIKVPFLAD